MTSELTLHLSREAERLGTARDLRRKHSASELTKLARGTYVDRAVWDALNPDERYRSTVMAAALNSDSGAQFSHDSAAAMWRLPSIGPWSGLVHELRPKGPGGTSRVGIKRHGLGLDPHPAHIDDISVTSLARTLVDISCSTSFARAVAMLDDGSRDKRVGVPRPPTKAELLALLDSLLPYRGSTRARLAINFCDPKSESPGESFSRVQFHALGLPAPELQVEFFDEFGSIGFADFYWRHLGLIGEFDGLSKYGVLRTYQRDMTLQQILLAEKAREDRMRRVSRSFVRLDWARVANRHGLAAYLRPHGLVARRGTRA